MYLQHFGLSAAPLGKQAKYIQQPQYQPLKQHCDWLLQTKGIGVIYGEAGTGKTAAIRQWQTTLNPHQYRLIYQADNHFPAFDIYSQLAYQLGLETKHRYSLLWRELKQDILQLYDDKHIQLIWVLDEAQQLPHKFLTDLPAFLNFAFDTRDILTIMLIGLPALDTTLNKKVYSALSSRVAFRYHWQSIETLEQFKACVRLAFEQAGKHEMLISDSGFNLLHMACQGRLRQAHTIINRCLQLACQQALNHIPDEVIETAINSIKNNTPA